VITVILMLSAHVAGHVTGIKTSRRLLLLNHIITQLAHTRSFLLLTQDDHTPRRD
jgi:hypothetical protein